jgi:hypothetical protein
MLMLGVRAFDGDALDTAPLSLEALRSKLTHHQQ